MSQLILIAHNIRSIHNVGSLFRTAEGFGIERIILSGYTPYPQIQGDVRLPHISTKMTTRIHKTALGAEGMVPFEYQEQLDLDSLKSRGYEIVGLEQDPSATPLPSFTVSEKTALLIGEEVDGIAQDLRSACDRLIEIPMYGKKESFNVSVAAGIALYGILAKS